MGLRQLDNVVCAGIAAILLCAAPLAAQQPRATATARTDSTRLMTPAELRAVGQAAVNGLVAQYGAIRDTALDRAIHGILERLLAASGYPELQLTFAVVNNPEPNAQALPGGFMVVNIGLVRFFTDEARQDAPGDAARQGDLVTAYVASTLAHELGHLTLGHPDELAQRARRLVASSGGRATTNPRTYEQALKLSDLAGVQQLQQLQHTREQESAADRAGALYMLRAGWTIEDAATVLRKFDALERGSNAMYSVGATTYLRSHPRSSEREADLVSLRADLMRHQRRFDDAISLISANVELDLAIALLDSVVVDFPDLIPVRHARGTAYAQKWLNTVPIQMQKVRASLPVYTAHFLPGIRGAPGDTILLKRAQADFSYVLSKQQLPLTMSNAAVLFAYSGNTAPAELMARQAITLLPQNTALINNLGVVLFVAGHYADARRSFESAIAAERPSPNPAYVFNLGKTLSQLKDPGAGAALRQFLASDDRSPWRQEAAALLGEPALAAPQGATAGGVAPPVWAGVKLGFTPDQVVALLGRPSEVTQGEGGAVWRYASRNLACVVSDRDGVLAILATARAAGTMDGVAVGDGTPAARARWGQPTVVQGPNWMFARSETWGVVLQQVDDVIVMLGVAAIQ